LPVLNQDLPFVEGDIGLIERVFENLMENAIRYTPENGTVEIRLEAGSNRITVHISDTGSGIPEDQLPHIFKRFYRLDNDGEKQAGHSGLGLAITRKILELHHSNIRVQSRLNLGTTISFHLSAVAPAA